MNKYTKKIRRSRKYYRINKHKYINRKSRKTKRMSNSILNRKIENRFKKLNAKTIKDLQNKFSKERYLLDSKQPTNRQLVNRQQIGCSNNKNNMSGGTSIVSDVLQKIEDFGSGTYNSLYGYPTIPSQDPIDQPRLANSLQP